MDQMCVPQRISLQAEVRDRTGRRDSTTEKCGVRTASSVQWTMTYPNMLRFARMTDSK